MSHGRLTGIIIVLLTAAFGPPVADACFCAPVCKGAATADAIFEATVASIETRSFPIPDGKAMRSERVVSLQDVRAWRGDVADTIVTGMGGGDCGYHFQVGVRYVVVGHRNQGDSRIQTGICSMTRPLAEAGSFREYVDSLSTPSRGGHLWGRVASGRVVTTRALPPVTIADAIVGARVSLSGPVGRAVTTGADGWFSALGLPPGDYAIDVALPRGAEALGSIEGVTVKLDGAYACAALDLRTRATGVVEGTVVDEGGLPVAGFLVYLQPVGYRVFGPYPPNAAVARGEVTDANGRYRFTDVPPGRYVTGSSIMVGPTTREPFAVTYGLTSSGDTELVLEQPGASLTVEPFVLRRLTPRGVTGRVTWSDGTPAAGVTVGAAAIGERGTIPAVSSTTAGDLGGFALALFEGARFEITVSRERRVIHRSEIVVTDERLVITVPMP